MRRARYVSLLAAYLMASAMVSKPAIAATSETAVKAAFLPRFAHYVTWPAQARPSPGQPLVLCTIGGDPFGRQLDIAAAGQSGSNQRILVRRLSSTEGVASCHVAFVSGRDGQPTGQILASLGKRSVLTVTDARMGSQRGAIHFAMVGGRVRFFIDNVAAQERGLIISSRLLDLAIAVRSR